MRSYIDRIRGVPLTDNADSPNIFLTETKEDLHALIQMPGFLEILQESNENLWFVCLETGVAAIINNDLDKLFIDEDGRRLT